MLPDLTDKVLWVIGLLSQITLFYVLVKNRVYVRFLFFTAFIAFEIFSSVALVLLFRVGDEHLHSLEYLGFSLADNVMQLCVIVEIGDQTLRSGRRWLPAARNGVIGTVVCGLIALAFVSVQLLPTSAMSTPDLLDMRLGVVSTLLSVVLFLAVVKTANKWGFLWTRHTLALGCGWGVWQLSAAAIEYGHLLRGWRWEDKSFEHAKLVIYIIITVLWSLGFALPDGETASIDADSERALALGIAKA